MFIIYNSFAIAVTQRRSEIGILRALGATRGQIRWLFLGESAVTGLIGSLGGVGVRRPDRARASRRRSARSISDVYGVGAARRRGRRRARGCSAAALAIGVATSIVAALVPARNAARVDPVQALQKGKYQVLSAGENRVRGVLAAVLGARLGRRASSSAARASCSTPATCSRLSPRCCSARCCRSALARAHPAGAEMAAAGRRRAGRRQPDSGAAADVGERRRADAVARARRRVRRHGARQLRLDHRLDEYGAQSRSVRPAVAEHRRSGRSGFRRRWAPELAAIAGVERVQMVRDARIVFRQTPVMVVAVEIDERRRRPRAARRSPATPTTCTGWRRRARG